MAEPSQPRPKTERTKLSVVIITRNEELNIRRCLESVKWAEEIVVVDQFSTDRTQEICREYTSHIHQRDMVDGFGPQKQFGVGHATQDWILSIDADEWLSDELSQSLQGLLNGEAPELHGYEVMRRTRYLGHWVMHCGWHVPIMRLFDRRHGGFNDRKIHETILVDGEVGLLDGELLHESYRSIRQHMEKLNLFSDFDAEVVDGRGVVLKPLNFWWYFAVKPILLFIRKFIFMQGFRDGISGFVISIFTGLATMIIYMKAWHLQEIRRREASRAADSTDP